MLSDKYKIIQQIDKGGFSKVYLGQNTQTDEYVAIKCEKKTITTPLLKNEIEVYLALNREYITPRFKSHGNTKKYNYIITELINKSLYSFIKEKKNFTLKIYKFKCLIL